MGSDMALFIVDHNTSKLLFGGGQGGTKKHLSTTDNNIDNIDMIHGGQTISKTWSVSSHCVRIRSSAETGSGLIFVAVEEVAILFYIFVSNGRKLSVSVQGHYNNCSNSLLE